MVALVRSLTTLFATAGSSSHSESIPPSPCVRICRYNADFCDGQVCIGCFRDSFEISQWSFGVTNEERSFALLDAADRADSRFEGSISEEELLRQALVWQGLEE